MLLPRLALAAALGAIAPLAAADDPHQGFALSPLPPVAGHAAMLSDGSFVAFDGLSFDRFAADGTLLESYGTLPSFVFPSFVQVSPDETFAVAGESSTGDLFRIDLAGGGVAVLASLPSNYDGVFAGTTELFVSSAPLGIGFDTEIHRVDAASGECVRVATVAGPSGPLAYDAVNGILYYATQSFTFPSPPGSTDVVYWFADQLDGEPELDLTDSFGLGLDFDGGSSMVVDPDTATVLLAETNLETGLNRIVQVFGGPSTSKVLVDGTPGRWIDDLSLVTPPSPAHLFEFQPPEGGTLAYASTDFQGFEARNALRPARPTAALSGPGVGGAGTVDLALEGGAAGGAYLVLAGSTALHDPDETAYLFPFTPPLFSGLDPGSMLVLPVVLPADGTGAATFTFPHDGTLGGELVLQGVVLDPSFLVKGTSEAAFL